MSTEEENKLLERQVELRQQLKELEEGNLSTREKGVELIEKGNKAQKEAYKEAEDFGKGVGDSLSGLLGTSSGLSASMKKLASGTLDADKMLQGFTKSIGANFSAMGIALSLVEKMVEATTALVYSADAALVSFQKQTGAVSTYGNMILGLEAKLYDVGIGMDLAAESAASLVVNIKNLDEMTPSTRRELVETTAVLAKMGIDSEITAQNMNFLTNSIGMLPEQAAASTRSMLMLAKELNTPPQEMAAAFQAARPQLAAFGSKAGDVFQKLALNAHNAQMEVGDLLRITEQFDKFDTAASSVGRLNAALGGPYLSTIKMVTTTDPTERMKMLSDAARQAGKSFDSMDYFERKMIASAMGLESVNELALVMAGRFDDLVKPIELTTDQIIAQESQLKDYNTIVEEFSQIMRAFAIQIVGPMITGLKGIANGITMLVKGPIPAIVAGIGLITAAVIVLFLAIDIMSGGTTALLRVLVTFLVTYGAGVLLVFKGIADIVRSSEPFMNKLTVAWEKITSAFGKFNAEGKEGSSVMSQLTETVDQFVSFAEPFIDMMLEDIVGSITIMIDNVLEMNKVLTDIGAWKFIGGVVAGFAGGILFAVAATLKLVTWIQWFAKHLTPIALLFGGWRDTMKDLGSMFSYVADEVTRMSNAISDSIPEMAEIGEFAESLLGFSEVKFVAESVKNGTFTRADDLERQNDSMMNAMVGAIKEAMESTTLNVSSQLEVISQNGLPALFDFFQRGMDDQQAGRSPQHAANATRSGIG